MSLQDKLIQDKLIQDKLIQDKLQEKVVLPGLLKPKEDSKIDSWSTHVSDLPCACFFERYSECIPSLCSDACQLLDANVNVQDNLTEHWRQHYFYQTISELANKLEKQKQNVYLAKQQISGSSTIIAVIHAKKLYCAGTILENQQSSSLSRPCSKYFADFSGALLFICQEVCCESQFQSEENEVLAKLSKEILFHTKVSKWALDKSKQFSQFLQSKQVAKKSAPSEFGIKFRGVKHPDTVEFLFTSNGKTTQTTSQTTSQTQNVSSTIKIASATQTPNAVSFSNASSPTMTSNTSLNSGSNLDWTSTEIKPIVPKSKASFSSDVQATKKHKPIPRKNPDPLVANQNTSQNIVIPNPEMKSEESFWKLCKEKFPFQFCKYTILNESASRNKEYSIYYAIGVHYPNTWISKEDKGYLEFAEHGIHHKICVTQSNKDATIALTDKSMNPKDNSLIKAEYLIGLAKVVYFLVWNPTLSFSQCPAKMLKYQPLIVCPNVSTCPKK